MERKKLIIDHSNTPPVSGPDLYAGLRIFQVLASDQPDTEWTGLVRKAFLAKWPDGSDALRVWARARALLLHVGSPAVQESSRLAAMEAEIEGEYDAAAEAHWHLCALLAVGVACPLTPSGHFVAGFAADVATIKAVFRESLRKMAPDAN